MRFSCKAYLMVILVGQLYGVDARMVVKDRTQVYTEECIDGKLFAHRLDYFEGVRKEQWSIEGKTVDAQSYEERILEAEKNERRRERQKDEKEKNDQQLFKMKAQRALLKKLLQAHVNLYFSDIALFERYHLEPYFCYAATTFTSYQAYTQFVMGALACAQKILNESIDEEDISELQELYEQLEAMQDAWKLFYRATVEQAIEKCNDTKMLKELLQLVA